MTESMIEKGRRFLARKFGVEANELVYIGGTDCSFMAAGAVLIQYNIMKKGHDQYKSTVGYKYEN